jgi:sugar phosphate isomerase/epimerase
MTAGPAAHRLSCLMNLGSLDASRRNSEAAFHDLRGAGYDGVQFVDFPALETVRAAQRLGLAVCGSGRVNTPAEAFELAQRGVDCGFECLTLHVGWGLEDDDEARALASALLEAAEKHRIPLYPETHRATIFQDMWRTVRLIERLPELRFNCDFSHWYTGQEMVYGGFEAKAAFIRPVIERAGFLHGRIGTPGCMQVDSGDGDPTGRPYVGHFRHLWTEVFRAYLRRPASGPFCFATELLGPEIYYARVFDGREESDRWQQALVLVRMAKECYREALA